MARRNRLRRSPRGRKGGAGRTILFILLAVILIVIAAGAFILFETEKPYVALEKETRFLGTSATLPLLASDRRSGISGITITLVQGGRENVIYSRTFPRKAWLSAAGPQEVRQKVLFDAKKAGLKNGKAELVLSVRDFSLNGFFRGNETVTRIPVVIDTTPPRVSIEHAQRYIRPGGSGIVIYRLSEPARKHGVRIDDMFFAGYPLKNFKDVFIAYIALPWNAKAPEQTRVTATDEAGNQGKAIFAMTFRKVPEKKDRINVSDAFLKRKIPEFEEYYPEMQGTLLEQYLFANNEIRRRNAEKIRQVCSDPVPEQLWQDRFLRMPGAGRAGFADQRTYYYQGRPIDHQTHLGMDIASTAHVPIKAANRGKVVFADYLGIYGNTVILDHGQGVYSLYAHLNRIDTSLDTMVDKGELIGHSGATGMAGGDHLHFSMLVHGIFVTPMEWWDQHWIDVNITDVINSIKP